MRNHTQFCADLAINLALEFLSQHRAGLVHPGCTSEPLSVPPSHLGQLPSLGPSDLFGLPFAFALDKLLQSCYKKGL
jgi:hypothetical protein